MGGGTEHPSRDLIGRGVEHRHNYYFSGVQNSLRFFKNNFKREIMLTNHPNKNYT